MTDNFTGVIIKESLENRDVLEKVKILKTKTEKVTDKHKTPELKTWTLYTIEITPEKAAKIADELSKCLLQNWYADFKDSRLHFIIFRNKVFRVNKNRAWEYEEAKKYGLIQGIPAHQLDFKSK